MNITQAIQHIHPQARPLRDFEVQDDGPSPVLRPGVDGLFRFPLLSLGPDETEEIEGVHYRYVVDFNRLILGEDYDIIYRGPYISAWYMEEPQPTDEELQTAWEELEALPPVAAPETSDEKLSRLERENVALKAEMAEKDRENKMAIFEVYSLLLGGE